MFTIKMSHYKHEDGTKEYYLTSVERDDGGASLAVFQWGSMGEALTGGKHRQTIIECSTAADARRQVEAKIRSRVRRKYKKFQYQTFALALDNLDQLHCYSRLTFENLAHLKEGYTGAVVTKGDMLDGPITTPEASPPPPVASVEERVKKNANWGMF